MEHVAAYTAPDSNPGHWPNQEGRVPEAPGGVWVHLGPDLGLRRTSLRTSPAHLSAHLSL